MTTIRYSDLLDDVLPSLNADPSDPVTEHAIKRAVIEFCARSWVWQSLQDPIDVQAGEPTYSLEAPSGADVAQVLNVMLDGQELRVQSPMWLNSNITDWRTQASYPRYYTQVDTENLILAPLPDSNIAGGLLITLALQPSQAALGFPNWIRDQHLYALSAGALSKLMAMPNKAWSDQNGALQQAAMFNAAIANARADGATGQGRTAIRVRGHH